MVLIKLGYNPKKKFNWEELPDDYEEKEYNGKFVVKFHQLLWEKVKNIMKIKEKGWDSLIMVDGMRRAGKSTVGKSIAYLLDPDLSIDNYVAGLEEAPQKIDDAKEGSVLIFDEGSLVASSKDGMTKKNKQLLKVIDVVGQKKLTLVFCMPSFFEISRSIAVSHSLFLVHVYTGENLQRGFFAYFGTKKKKLLYEIGKKHHNSYKKPKAEFTGKFDDFILPFEEEYLKLKRASLQEAIDPNASKNGKGIPLTESDYKTQFMMNFRKNNPDITVKNIQLGFGVSDTEFYRRKKNFEKTLTP